MDSVREVINEEIRKCETIIRGAEQSLKKAPEGRLRIATGHNRSQCYHVTEKTSTSGVYLGKDDEKLIAALAQKQYDESVLKKARERLNTLLRIKAAWKGEDLGDIYRDLHKARQPYVKPIALPDDMYLKQWTERPCSKSDYRPEELVHRTNGGEYVRSKSEALIANRLRERGIPYKYECRLVLPDSTWEWPDFTILNVRRQEELYYEHLGRLDESRYVNRNLKKIKDYQRNDIILGERLFVTFETEMRPFDIRDLDVLINKFFL